MSGPARSATEVTYVHEAFFYNGVGEFVTSSVEFVAEGQRRGEHVVVAVIPEKIELLREALGEAAARVTFIDMAAHGRNPARVIQVWRDICDAAELRGAAVRGIGEPIWPGRTEVEISEAHLHEALLNEAFGVDQRLLLRCPYDVSQLDTEVVATARCSHPTVVVDQSRETSDVYSPDFLVHRAFRDPLTPPGEVEVAFPYAEEDLSALRRVVERLASRHGMSQQRMDALRLSVQEIAANTVRHGGGIGSMRAWSEDGMLVCELRDSGRIRETMVGRLRPRPEDENGRGVWLANQLCDLVQIRSSSQGTVVRLYLELHPEPADIAG